MAMGSSIGGLYYYFEDFDELVLHLNAETLTQLDLALLRATTAARGAMPATVVDAYFDFVEANDADWTALFEHHLAANYVLPDWYQEVVDRLIGHMSDALTPFLPHMELQDRLYFIVGLWAGLHGLSSLDREGKLATVRDGSSARAIGHMLVAAALGGVSKGR